ncbi:hypothetical protein Q1695_012178 [Nippostrongylus brasiliensis]|nr:hypothetical protein Q1695_012178 [Nippostrongylus brasiliensis]
MSIPLSTVLQDVEDTDPVHGREAKLLRDAAVEAISDVRDESRSTSAQLAQEICSGNSSLLSDLNASFVAVDNSIRAIPTIASFSPDGSLPKIPAFSGSGDGIQFSVWLRHFEDVVRMLTVPLSSEQKANLLIAYLDGPAREKIDDLSDEDRRAFETIVAHLRGVFEGPHQRNMAQQALTSCRQEPLEAFAAFANRLLPLVRAFMAGQGQAAQRERLLDEFVNRLSPDIRYFVKLEGPASFEDAVNRAQTIEQLLAEATADRLINPANHPMVSASVYNCSRILPVASAAPRNMTIRLYRPNTKRYESSAALCKVIDHTVTYSVNLVGVRYGSAAPESPVGDTRHCTYKDGFCVPREGEVLLWTPAKEELYPYIWVTKMSAHLVGHIWLSDSKEFALSWSDSSPSVTSCGYSLIISDQGYGVDFPRRAARSTDTVPPVGLVTSNQLAAQLMAVEGVLRGGLAALFRHALLSL